MLFARLGQTASLTISVVGNLSLVWLFGDALLFPLAHEDFLRRTGVALGFIEFASAHSSVMLAAARRPGGGGLFRRLYFVFLYGFFAALVGLTFDNLLLPLIFVVSLLSKAFGRVTKSETLPSTLVYLVLVIGTLGIAALLAQGLERVAPLEPELARRLGGTGELRGVPRLFPIWGVLYYSLAALLEIVLHLWGEEVERWQPWVRRRRR